MRKHDKRNDGYGIGGWSRSPAHLQLWEKSLAFVFLSLTVIISALGVFQCITLWTNVYFRATASSLRNVDLGLIALSLFTFGCWSITAARWFADFVADYIVAAVLRRKQRS